MCAPSPPASPDYAGAAQQQGQANIDAAKVQGQINNPNVVSPYGTQTVSFMSDRPLSDQEKKYQEMGIEPAGAGTIRYGGKVFPVDQFSAGWGLDVPSLTEYANRYGNQPTVTQKFSPEQQRIYDLQTNVKELLGGIGVQGATALGDVVGKNLDYSDIPSLPGDSTATRDKVIDAMMSRVNTDYGIKKDDVHSDLIASGIRPGNKAYENEMDRLERGLTDARQQAIIASGQEASRDFGLDMERRRSAIADMLTQRQVPLNEITALMSGSQVNNPFATPGYAQNAQVGAAPVFGATTAAGDYATDVYNAKAAQAGNLQKGLFGLGAAGIGAYGMAAGAPNITNFYGY